MKLVRRQFAGFCGAAAVLAFGSRVGHAQAYPVRPVRLVVGFTPGGGNDIVARVVARWLTEQLGQSFVVESRPGAAGNIATESVVRASPDGYTLLQVGLANVVNATLYESLPYNFLRDIAPVAGLIRYPQVMVVHPSLSVTTPAEFIAYATANPGKVNMSSVGNGSVGHLCGELLRMLTGVELVHIPYRGNGPALADLLAGQVAVTFASAPSALGYVRTGKLRALALTSASRLETLRNIPTMAEFVGGYEVSSWYGIGVPRSTPLEVVDRLNKTINAGLADTDMKERFAELGGTVFPVSPVDFGDHLAKETEKWGKVVKFAGVKIT